MIPFLYETAAFYGAPLSVWPIRHHDLRSFIDLVLKEGDSRLKNLLPLILAKQAEGRSNLFDQWASQDRTFQVCWEFTQLALRQTRENIWNEGDRDHWCRSCKTVGRIGIEHNRALTHLRRFLP